MRTLHMFAGAGGGLYADLIMGHEPVGAIEYDHYACERLREQRDAGWWPGLEVVERDIRECDPRHWEGRVDCLHAGFPCQDISAAGGGAGIEHGKKSGLWSEVERFLCDLRPDFAFLENSPVIASRGLDRVLRDLAALGYDADWTVLSAGDVGAPHQRKRWWCLAHTECMRRGESAAYLDSKGKSFCAPKRQKSSVRTRSGGEDVSNAKPARLEGYWTDAGKEKKPKFGNGGPLGDANSIDGRSGTGRENGAEINDASWWATEPEVGRVANGVADRVNRLKCLGNGQVPLCAAVAFTVLMRRCRGNR